MDVCEDNSTACLLRQIYEENTDYNWDPLSFAFTVAIGVLAFIVACMTVFQGALAAGPGRIKASAKAIGEWSQYSYSRFDRRELRVRTVTLVPFIQLFDSPGTLDKQLHGTPTTIGGYADIVKILQRSTRQFPIKPVHNKLNWAQGDSNVTTIRSNNYAASWANLLARLQGSRDYFIAHGSSAMADQDFIGSVPKALLCEADYLPSDVSAAVAAGNIQSIITVAAFVGCDEIGLVSRLPEARGNNLQLSFREHALLGPVAVSQDFPMKDTYRSEFDRPLFDTRVGPGLLSSHTPYLAPRFLGTRASMAILYDKSPPWLRAVTFSSMKYSAVAKYVCTLAAPWCALDARSIVCAIYKHVAKHNGFLYFDSYGLSNMFGREALEMTTAYTSDRNSSSVGVLGPQMDGRCYQNTTSWADRSQLRSFKEKGATSWAIIDGKTEAIEDLPPSKGRLLHTLDSLARITESPTDLDAFDCAAFLGESRKWTRTAVAEREVFFVLLPLALRCCLDFLEDKFAYQELSFVDKSHTRGALRHQLHEIDHWLLRHDREAAMIECRKFLHDVTETESRLEDVRLQRKGQASMQEAMKNITDADLIATLLTFRAVLLAAFLSTAADVSCVTGTALGRRVVQCL